MKRTLLVSLFALVLVFAGAQSAFALHGGYSNTTISCGECHAVHNAVDSKTPDAGVRTLFKNGASLENTQAAWLAAGGAGTKTLTAASTTEDLCEYCHMYSYSVSGSHYVYKNGTDTSNFTAGHSIGAVSEVPEGSLSNISRDGLTGLGCVDCHDALPHAAKFNRVAGNKYGGHYYYSQDLGTTNGFGTSAQGNLAAMCARCHSDAAIASANHGMAIGNGAFTANATTYGSTRVAFSKAENCIDCHNNSSVEYHSINNGKIALNEPAGFNGNSLTATSTISNTSTGTVFTNYYKTYARGNVEMSDVICLSCHTDGTVSNGAVTGATAGVGTTY